MTQVTAGTTAAVVDERAACDNGTAACEEHGFARRFEYRPDFRLGTDLVPDVVDASTIRERKLDDLMVVRTVSPNSELSSESKEVGLVPADRDQGDSKFACTKFCGYRCAQ